MPIKRLFIVLLLSASVVGCSGSPRDQQSAHRDVTLSDVNNEAKELGHTAAVFATQRKEAYIANVEKRLVTIEREIEEIQGKAVDLRGEAKENLHAKLEALRAQRKDVREKIVELRAATGEAWAELQKGSSAAISDLKVAVRQAAESFR